MAKKAPKVTKEYNMNDLSSFLTELSEWGGTLDDEKFSAINDWISTGNYALNALISGDIFKGIPSGRVTTLAAPESTGKTFLALNIAREAQRKGYYVIWFDTENAFDAKQAVENFGIEASKLRLEKINTVTELTIYCKKLTAKFIEAKKEGHEIPKILLVVDSIGNLASHKEVQDILEGEKKVDMTRAKDIKGMFRILTTDLGKLDIPMVAINHVYANTTSFFGGNAQSGGSGLKYLGSVNVELSKAQLKEGNDRVGITVTAKLEKARFSAPYKPIKLQIRFDKGMNKYIGLETFMDEDTFDILGYGPGRINETGKYTYADTEFPNSWALKDGNKNTTRKTIYKNSFFSQERLEKLNEIVKQKLSYKHAMVEDEEILGDEDEQI